MTDRMQVFSREELNRIHDASLDILSSIGVQFNSELALKLFHRHGFKLDKSCVFFTEKEVAAALEQIPSRFRVYARNPAHNVSIGEEDFVFLPTGGAPNVTTLEGELRPATLMMSTAVRNGANFILHACGQLGSYISMSFEKWLIDEEVCRTLRRVLSCIQISAESIDLETIKQVGIKGSYLLHPTTFNHCRDLYRPEIFTRNDYAGWRRSGAKRVDQEAGQHLALRLGRYKRPEVDPGLEQALTDFVNHRKTGKIPARNIDDALRKTYD